MYKKKNDFSKLLLLDKSVQVKNRSTDAKKTSTQPKNWVNLFGVVPTFYRVFSEICFSRFDTTLC